MPRPLRPAAGSRRKKRPQSRLGPNQSTRSPPPTARVTRNEHSRNIEELCERIRSLSATEWPVPTADDPVILGFDLKLRLAGRAPVFIETGRRGERTSVAVAKTDHRYVPVWDIDGEQDPTLLCQIKVKLA